MAAVAAGGVTAGAGVGGSAAARATWASAVACLAAVVARGCGPCALASLATGAGRDASAKLLAAIVLRGVCRRGVSASATSVGGSGRGGAGWRAIWTALGWDSAAGASATVRCGSCVSVLRTRHRRGDCFGRSRLPASRRRRVGRADSLAAVATSGRVVARVRWLGTETGAWANSGSCCVRN